MLTLYGDLDSGNVYKVRLLLAQLGIAYRRVDEAFKADRGDRRQIPDRERLTLRRFAACQPV
jgi:glutathione S-transferase